MRYYINKNGHDYLKISNTEATKGHFSRNLKSADGKYCYELCDASLIMLDAEILKLHWVEITESEYKSAIVALANLFENMLRRIAAQDAILEN